MGQKSLDPNDLIQKLHQRGIADETCRVFEIEPYHRDGLTGWTYPTLAGSLRFKNVDSKGKPKYGWVNPATMRLEANQKRPGDIYYHGPDFIEAVQAAGGVAYQASGEADTWALYSAGIHNVFAAGYGEGNQTDDLNNFCLQTAITDLRLFPDLDGPGQKWASRIYGMMGSAVTARRLPGEMGSKYDLGKAWVDFQTGQGGNFEAWLNSLPILEIEPPARPAKRATGYFVPSGGLFDQWKAEIFAAYEAIPGKGTRHYIHCPNPHHADQNESFRIDKDKGPVCTCDIHHEENKWDLVAEWFGLPTYAEYKKQHLDTHRAGGVGFVSFTHRPPLENTPHISTTSIVSTQDSLEIAPPEPIRTGFKDLLPDGWKPEATTGQRVNYLDVADLLDMAESYGPAVYTFPGGMLPDVFRSTLLDLRKHSRKYKIPDFGPLVCVLEALSMGIYDGTIDPCDWTQADLKAYAPQISEYTFKNGFKILSGIFGRKLHPYIEDINNKGQKTSHNSAGRPEAHYQQVTLNEAIPALLAYLKAVLWQSLAGNEVDAPPDLEPNREIRNIYQQIDDEHPAPERAALERELNRIFDDLSQRLDLARLMRAFSTPIDRAAWESGAMYRRKYAVATLEAAGGERVEPLCVTAARLGCSETTARNIERDVNILSIDQFKQGQIAVKADLQTEAMKPQRIAEIRQQMKEILSGSGRAWFCVDGNPRLKHVIHSLDETATEIDRLLSLGHTVEIIAQTASLHKFAPPEVIQADIQRRREQYAEMIKRNPREPRKPSEPKYLGTIQLDETFFTQFRAAVCLTYMLKIQPTDPRRERLSRHYAELMKGETMPKNEAYKDADLEAAPVVIPTPTANPLPVVTAAPTNRTISPVGQGGYPFGKEKYRLPGLPTDLPNYRDLQKGA